MPFRLRTFDLVMLVISLVIGMGIFRTPATVAATVGSESMYYLAWLVGGIIALMGALTFAELGRRVPDTGAYYRVFARAYHPVLAFGINIIIVVSNAASAAGVSIIGAEYVRQTIPALDVRLAACVFLAGLYCVNLAGLKASVKTQNLLIGIKLLLLGAIILAPFLVMPVAAQASAPAAPSVDASVWGFGAALVAVAFTYGGYQQTINFGGEASSDGRTVSRSIVLGVVIVTSLYLLASWAYASVLGFETLHQNPALASAVLQRLLGPSGSHFVTAILLISVFGYVNVSMLSNPRVITAMADDGMLPERFGSLRSDADLRVSRLTLSAYAAMSLLCVYVGETFEAILSYTIFLDSIGMATAAAAIFIIPSDRPMSRLLRTCAICFCLSYCFIAVSIGTNQPVAAAYGVLLLALMMLLSFITRQTGKRGTA